MGLDAWARTAKLALCAPSLGRPWTVPGPSLVRPWTVPGPSLVRPWGLACPPVSVGLAVTGLNGLGADGLCGGDLQAFAGFWGFRLSVTSEFRSLQDFRILSGFRRLQDFGNARICANAWCGAFCCDFSCGFGAGRGGCSWDAGRAVVSALSACRICGNRPGSVGAALLEQLEVPMGARAYAPDVCSLTTFFTVNRWERKGRIFETWTGLF